MKTRFRISKTLGKLSVNSFFLKISFIFLFWSLFMVCSYTQDVIATIHFDQLSGQTIKPGAFGLNVPQGFNPDVAGNPGKQKYKEAMSYMAPGLIRYHGWEQFESSTSPSGWLTSSLDSWDSGKINRAMTGSYSYGPVRMMNIPHWPRAWDNTDGTLQLSRYADFANFCASLVKIINIDQRRGVKYWEITNEADGAYDKNCAELGRIINRAAAAMKQVDPTIKCGGPAFQQPDLIVRVDSFLKITADHLDFISWHSYATGDYDADLQTIWSSGFGQGNFVSSMKTEFAKYSTRTIEYFHDEFNINWGWSPPDKKMSDYRGMIFDALFIVTAINGGVTGTMAWNESEDAYGKMDPSFNKRPGAYLYHIFNKKLIGNSICNSNSGDNKKLVVLAAKNDSLLQFVVINRSGSDQHYKFSFTGLPPEVHGATLFDDVQCLQEGGLANKLVSYEQLTSRYVALFEKNTVSILSIDLRKLKK